MVSSRLIDGTTPAGKDVHGLVKDAAEPVHDFLAELVHPDLQDFYAAFEKLVESAQWEQLGQWFKPCITQATFGRCPHPTTASLGFGTAPRWY